MRGTSGEYWHSVHTEVEGLQLHIQGEGLCARLPHKLHGPESDIAHQSAVPAAVASRCVGNREGIQRLISIADRPPQLEGVS